MLVTSAGTLSTLALLQAVQKRLLDGKTTVVKAALQLYQVMVE